MKKRDKLIILLTVIAMILILVVGTTYAYFTASVEGNDTAKDVQVEAGTMSLKLDGTTITSLENALPGSTHTINFSVENTGTLETTYSLEMIDIKNTFVDRNDLVYTITSTNNGGSKSETIAPNANEYLINKISIKPNTIQKYTMTIHFKETGDNQNDNQNVMFIGKVQINSKVLELPDEYQELEYIESSGTQFINTLYKPTNNTKVNVGFKYNALTGFIYGSRTEMNNPDAHAFIYVPNQGAYTMFSVQQTSVSLPMQINEYHILENAQEGAYLDGKKIKNFNDANFTSSLNMYLFALNQNNSVESRTMKGKIYYFKIYESNKIQKYFIPAKRKSDNVIGMYDLINNEFYTNSGTGTFTGN